MHYTDVASLHVGCRANILVLQTDGDRCLYSDLVIFFLIGKAWSDFLVSIVNSPNGFQVKI